MDVAKEPPTLDEEIQTYLANSRYYKTVEEMKAAPSTKVKATKFETDAGDPLPDLATLKAMADNLGKLYAVSVSTTAKTKVNFFAKSTPSSSPHLNATASIEPWCSFTNPLSSNWTS